ncbi:MAG TPA: hypothetical protein VLA95_07445 [Gemmatimonadales bacterium]|nr:hypothetical protein [Gemmatimonadales bacterium]
MRAALVGVVALAAPATAAAQDPAVVPIVTRLPASVRSAALGGAGVALTGYAGAVFDNPSAVAPLRVTTVELAWSDYAAGAGQGMGAASLRVGPLTLAGGAQYLRFADTARVKDNLSWVAALVYRGGLGALGADVRYVSVEDTAGQINRALTTDAGVTFAFFDIAALAVAVQGIGTLRASGRRLDLPLVTRLGFTLNLVDPLGVPRLLGTIESIWTEGDEHRWAGGLEGGLVSPGGFGLLGRIGVAEVPAESGLSSLSAGAGFVFPGFRLDYAYQRRNVFGVPVHRLGLRFSP